MNKSLPRQYVYDIHQILGFLSSLSIYPDTNKFWGIFSTIRGKKPLELGRNCLE